MYVLSNLVEVRVLHQNEALNGNQELEECRGIGIPPGSIPGVEEGETHPPVVVEVGVKTNTAATCRKELDLLHHMCITFIS